MLSRRTWAILGVALLAISPAFAALHSPIPHTSSPSSTVPSASAREEGLPFGLHQACVSGTITPEMYQNPTTINLNGYTFDTRKGEPVLPTNLKITGYKGGVGYYLVQFNGPITEAIRSDLTSRGAEIMEYIPNYAYLVRMSDASKAQVSVVDGVSFVGLFQPAYKLASYLPTTSGIQDVNILLFRGENARETMEDLKNDFGAEIIEAASSNWCHSIRAKVDAAKFAAIARLPAVRWIEPHAQMHTLNATAQWTVQDNTSNTRQIWYVNGSNNSGGTRLTGQGQVVGHSDTGVYTAHYAFYDAAHPITTFGDYPTHRKVIAYKAGSMEVSKNGFGDEMGHGTHTCGTLCGNDSANSGSRNQYCGMAPYAKEYFVDIGITGGTLVVPQIYFDMWQPAYTGNAGGACRIFSESWGGGTNGQYDAGAQSHDQFMWDHKDFLLFVAAGNSGSGGSTIQPPATAKDIVTVGATLNGSGANTIASYSSRGPVADTRLKPTICCPGDGVTLYSGMYSAAYNTTNSYALMQGTSMASPDAAGHCALVRQYFTEGWYPSGSANVGNAFIPSAALMKAVLVNSGDSTAQIYPNNNYGFGRINLWKTLHFTGTTSNTPLWVVDEQGGLGTGEYRDYTIPVLAGAPIKVALVWTDYPGALTTSPELVNNLDLLLTDPSANQYKGNVLTNGESQTGGTADARNVEEICRRRAPAAGNWVVRVTGTNCPMGPQPYALVVTGNLDFAAAPQIIASAITVVNPKNALIPNRTDTVRVTLTNVGTAAATATSGILRSLSGYATIVDSAANYGDIPANGGSATASFRVQCNTGMDCWSQLPFTVYWTASGPVSDYAGFPITANLPDSGSDYVVWGWGDNTDYKTWVTMLQKQGYRGWWIFDKALPVLSRPNPQVLFALMPGLSGTATYDYPVADSFAVGAKNDTIINNFLTNNPSDVGGVYTQAPGFGFASIDATGPRYGRVYLSKTGVTYLAAMDTEHRITAVNGVAGQYFSSFTFNYNPADTGFNTAAPGCDIDGIQKTGTGVNFMRFASLRNDTCLVGNISASNYKCLTATYLLRGLRDTTTGTKAAYVDSVMHWFGVFATVGVEAGNPALPLRTEFQVGRPNPTKGATTFNYQLAAGTKASLKIYNLAGQLVRTLVNGTVPAGAHEAVWDGKADGGKRVSAGVYLVRFEAGTYTATKKAVVVR
jgi:hypothetical protein